MSDSLTLLPFDGESGGSSYSHTVLRCWDNSTFFDEIRKLPAVRVPEEFNSYVCYDNDNEPMHYGNTQETPLGNPLTFVLAEQLAQFSAQAVDSGYQNKAIWAYLAELPPRTKVALYWH